MGKIGIAAVGVLVVSMTVLSGPVGAAQHDRDCQFPASPNGDAADVWNVAAVLVDRNCTGEMLVNGDSEDWYRVPLPLAAGNVRLCPTTVKTAPWNPDLALWVRADAMPNGPLATLPPGVPAGTGANLVACEDLTLPPKYNVADAQVYIHIHRAGGDGLYNLVVS